MISSVYIHPAAGEQPPHAEFPELPGNAVRVRAGDVTIAAETHYRQITHAQAAAWYRALAEAAAAASEWHAHAAHAETAAKEGQQ